MRNMYRKRPVEIEAHRLTEESVDEVVTWLGDTSHEVTGDGVVIKTLEGHMLAGWGDWVAQDKGGFYPIKDDIFQMTYEATRPGRAVGESRRAN